MGTVWRTINDLSRFSQGLAQFTRLQPGLALIWFDPQHGFIDFDNTKTETYLVIMMNQSSSSHGIDLSSSDQTSKRRSWARVTNDW